MPNSANAHVSGALTNVAMHYQSSEFVLSGAAPAVQVPHKSLPYQIFTKEDWYKNEAGVRGTSGHFPRVDFRLSSTTFNCLTKGLAVPVPDETVDNADPSVQPEVNATILSTEGVMRKHEIDTATVLTGSTWTAGSAVDATGTEWNAADGGSIDANTETVIQAVHDSIGRNPNLGVMGWKVWRTVRKNPVLREFKAGGTGKLDRVIGMEDWIEFTGVPRWIIVPGIYASNAEGGTFTAAQIMTDSVWIGWVAPSPSVLLPSALYSFQFRNLMTKVYREEAAGQKVVETQKSYDVKATALDAGQLIQNVL